jgi:hypothetical protein
VSSVYYNPHLPFPGNRFNKVEILQLPTHRSSFHRARAELLSTGNSTNWIQAGGHFTPTPSLLFTGWLATELNSLTHQPAASRHFTQLTAFRLLSSLYILGTDPTENIASNNPSIVIMGGCSDILDIVSAGMCLLSRCLETDVCSSTYCIAVLDVRFQVSAHQRVYTLLCLSISLTNVHVTVRGPSVVVKPWRYCAQLPSARMWHF